jgi:competence protein ComEA
MRGADTAQASLWLAALLFAAAWPASGPAPAKCARPGERAALAGATREVGCAGGAELRGPARLLYGLPIDPNHADADTLETLPGIGPGRAAAIVAAREQRPFASAADLRRVPGIGPLTLARIARFLAVDAGATGGAAAARNR